MNGVSNNMLSINSISSTASYPFGNGHSTLLIITEALPPTGICLNTFGFYPNIFFSIFLYSLSIKLDKAEFA